jgi:hypothetical protein
LVYTFGGSPSKVYLDMENSSRRKLWCAGCMWLCALKTTDYLSPLELYQKETQRVWIGNLSDRTHTSVEDRKGRSRKDLQRKNTYCDECMFISLYDIECTDPFLASRFFITLYICKDPYSLHVQALDFKNGHPFA